MKRNDLNPLEFTAYLRSKNKSWWWKDVGDKVQEYYSNNELIAICIFINEAITYTVD